MKSKSISISEFQKKEITQAAFKRNKIYLDLDQIQRQEKIYSMKNRQPLQVSKSPKSKKVDNNISNIFRHSVKELNSKLEEETKRFKQRVSFSLVQDCKQDDQVETGYQTERTSNNPQTDEQHDSKELNQSLSKNAKGFTFHLTRQRFAKNRIKGIPLDKQITRQYLHRYSVQKNSVVDERNFNNFYINKGDLSKTQDFKKLSPRNINFVHQHINDINYDTQKKYQSFYFSTQPMKSIFRMSLQNDQHGRKFFEPMREENLAKTALDPEKIKKSFSQTSNFKQNKIDPFYKMSGRQLPHQLDQKRLSPNCNYYKDKDGKLIKPKVDYGIKILYENLIIKQQEQLYRKKNPEFTRDQICDQRYFNEMMKRQNKMRFRRF